MIDSIKKFIISVLMLWAVGMCHAVTLPEIVAEVSAGSYSNWLGSLYASDGNSRGFTHRDSPRVPLLQHDLARDFMVTNFQAMGYDTWPDPFTFTSSRTGYVYSNCNNVVAVKWGYGGTNVYIIGAHYDSVDLGDSTAPSLTNACPGADDDASGTAALLEVAKAIKDYVFRDTIIIVALDAEEKDYWGSKHFVTHHIAELASETNKTIFLKSSIRAMVNVDTIAYDDTNTPRYVVIGNVGRETSPVAFALAESVTRYTSLLPYHGSDYNQSDHKIFQTAGIDSVQLIEYDFRDYWGVGLTENPHYHSDGDSIDSPNYISYDYAAEITKVVVGALCDYAGVIPPVTPVTSAVDADTIQINWVGAPNVSYSLYGTETLSESALWGFIQKFPATNITAEFSIQLDITDTNQIMYRVFSE